MSKKEISRQFDGNSGAITNAPDNDKIKGAAVPAESPDAAAGEAGEEKPVFNQIAYQNEYNRQKYDRA